MDETAFRAWCVDRAEFFQRHWNARDFDSAFSVLAEHHQGRSLRSFGNEPVTSRAETLDALRLLRDLLPEMTTTLEEVRPPTCALSQVVYRDAQGNELATLQVSRTLEGEVVETTVFEVDDLEAARAELDRLARLSSVDETATD